MVRLEVKGDAPFEYTTYRPSESLYVVDLTGVSAGDAAGVRVVSSDLVKSYRLSAYTSGGKPVVRLEVLLNPGVQPKLERADAKDLNILVSRDGNSQRGSSGPRCDHVGEVHRNSSGGQELRTSTNGETSPARSSK